MEDMLNKKPLALLLCSSELSISYLLTYPMEQSPSWEANRFVASQEIPRIFVLRNYITAFTSARHPSLSWASSIQFIHTRPISLRSILILSTHLRMDLQSGLLSSVFPTKTLYTPPLSPTPAYVPTVASRLIY
jgi:hypothetical protein